MTQVKFNLDGQTFLGRMYPSGSIKYLDGAETKCIRKEKVSELTTCTPLPKRSSKVNTLVYETAR